MDHLTNALDYHALRPNIGSTRIWTSNLPSKKDLGLKMKKDIHSDWHPNRKLYTLSVFHQLNLEEIMYAPRAFQKECWYSAHINTSEWWGDSRPRGLIRATLFLNMVHISEKCSSFRYNIQLVLLNENLWESVAILKSFKNAYYLFITRKLVNWLIKSNSIQENDLQL